MEARKKELRIIDPFRSGKMYNYRAAKHSDTNIILDVITTHKDVEIIEGDVFNNLYGTFVIYWDDKSFGYRAQYDDTLMNVNLLVALNQEAVKIGNVFQTPDILKS